MIHPGDPTIKDDFHISHVEHGNISPLDTFLDVIRNMFPENVVQSSFQRIQTMYTPKKEKIHNTSKTANETTRLEKKITYVPGLNILGIIVFSTGFGIIVSQLQERARIIVDFFIIFEAVIMKLVEILMW